MFTESVHSGEKSLNRLFTARGLCAKTFFALFLLSFGLLFPLGCKKASQSGESAETASKILTPETESVPSVSYYFFDRGNITQCSGFDAIPEREFRPWTEAEHASGAVLLHKPLFLINKVGILRLTEEADTLKPAIIPFSPLFQNATSQDFFLSGNALLFRTYKNSFFTNITETPSNAEAAPFLGKYNPITETFSAALTSADIGLPPQAQCTHLQRYRAGYLLSFKTENQATVDFSFFRCDSPDDLLQKNVTALSKGAFQDAAVPEDIIPGKRYADTLKTEIAFFAEKACSTRNAKVRLAVYTASGESAQLFSFVTNGGNPAQIIEADMHAWFDKTANALSLLSPKGKLYRICSGDATPVMTDFHLPELPEGFAYTYFAVENVASDDTSNSEAQSKTGMDKNNVIIAFWEERAFFRIGRSGMVIMPAKGLEPLRSCPQ